MKDLFEHTSLELQLIDLLMESSLHALLADVQINGVFTFTS